MTIDDRRAGAACTLVGALAAVLPHLGELATAGTAQYLASGDDVLYLAVAKSAIRHGWALKDPFEGTLPALYSWLQFVPLAKVWAALGLPLLWLPIAWRVLGGALLGFSLFALLRRALGPLQRATYWALGCSLVCLLDPGFIRGRPVIDALGLVFHAVAGTTPNDTSGAYNQYRVVTPVLNLPFLLFFAATILPGRSHDWKRLAAAGALLAACVYLYFFFWTGAALALALLASAHALKSWNGLSRGARFYGVHRARFALAALAIGLVLGAAQIWWNARVLADPAFREPLDRMARGLELPAGDGGRYQYLWNTWIWLKLAVGAYGIHFMRMRRLAPLFALTLAGYLLRNSAAVTGLEFENYHWALVSNPFGEIMVLAVAAAVLERRLGRPEMLRPFWAVPAVLALIALVWIPTEPSRSRESREARDTLAALEPLRPHLAALPPGCVLAGPPVVNVAYLLSPCDGQLYQYDHSSQSSLIGAAAVHERHALNAWIQEMGSAEYAPQAAGTFNTIGLSRPEWSAESVRISRLDIFARLESDPGYARELTERYRPGYLLLQDQRGTPRRGGTWKFVAAGGNWNLWAREPGT